MYGLMWKKISFGAVGKERTDHGKMHLKFLGAHNRTKQNKKKLKSQRSKFKDKSLRRDRESLSRYAGGCGLVSKREFFSGGENSKIQIEVI